MAPFPYMNAILDSLTAHIAVLDQDGMIIAVNEAWREFGRENGLTALYDGVGSSYLKACLAGDEDDPDGPANGIQAVLEGRSSLFVHEYPCDSPTEQRWFLLRVTAIGDANVRHCVVAHENITERNLAEFELRESERLYRSLLSHVPGYVYLADPADPGNIIYQFERDVPLLGFVQDEWREDPRFWTSLLHPDDRELIAESDRRAGETGEPYLTEYRYLTPDGDTIWVRDSGKLVRDEDGQPLYWLGISFNITDQKNIELALAESEVRFRSAFDDASIPMAIANLEDRFVRVNEAYCDLFGGTAEEILSFSVLDRLHLEDLPTALADRDALIVGDGARLHAERRLVRLDGSLIYALLGVSVIQDSNGQRFLLSQVQDISDRKASEDRLQEATDMLQAMFDASPVAIVVLDPDSNVVEWNPMAEKLFGWTADEVVGRPIPIIPENLQDDAVARQLRMLEGEAFRTVETSRLHKDGTRIDVSISGATVRTAEGAIRGSMAVYVDLTEQKAYEASRRRRDRVLGMVSGTSGLTKILVSLCNLVESEIEGTMASIMMTDDSGKRLFHAAEPNLPESYCQAIDGVAIGPSVGSCGSALFRKVPIHCGVVTTSSPGRMTCVHAGRYRSSVTATLSSAPLVCTVARFVSRLTRSWRPCTGQLTWRVSPSNASAPMSAYG